MALAEQGSVPESLRTAIAWLGARHGGASLVEFIQRLPTEAAENIRAASLELKRLKLEGAKHSKKASYIRLWSWVGGTVAVIVADVALCGSLVPTPRIVAAIITIILGIWWFSSRAIRREIALASDATIARIVLEDSAFKKIGITYNEAAGTVHSLVRRAEDHREVQQGLLGSHAAYEEIQRGAKLARDAGINPSLFQHRDRLLSTVLGGMPTDDLLHHPDCERLFHEMCKLGLRNHTVEAILSRPTSVGLPIFARTLALAKVRMQKDS
ncbi:MAG: hypothetical protein ABL907_08290 [Hyphomicrobium sp.]